MRIFLLGMIAVVLIACSSSVPIQNEATPETPKVSQDVGPSKTPTPRPTQMPTPAPSKTPTPRPTQTPAPAPLIYEFQGSGDSVKGPFTLVPGLVSVVASHSGNGNFIVEMVGPSSTEVSINEIGLGCSGACGSIEQYLWVVPRFTSLAS